MTTTQTDRELDARVAVEVMGWSDAPIALGTPGHPVAVWRDRVGDYARAALAALDAEREG